ncbi:hypothetical protein Pfo_007008 [Paulownia fortunei]|nr:hypothetical protein Pfo_007008 [Paulownia fortunei]
MDRINKAHWPTSTSPSFGMHHDQEECLSPTHNKKSVLAKVKERAKKLRHTLSGRKNQGNELSDDNSTTSWGVTLDDDDDDERDDDPEYLGAPMSNYKDLHLIQFHLKFFSNLHSVYESEAAPENLKENARQHPRAVPVVSEKHVFTNRMKHEATPENEKPVSPNMTMTEAVSEKFAPAYAAMSDTTHKIASKIAGLTIKAPEAQETAAIPTQVQGGAHETRSSAAQIAVPSRQGYEAKNRIENSGNLKQYGSSSPQTWDKGVSVKEYFMTKLEPGEDERALSQAITEAISPRRSTGDTGVVEKVKEAVTSFFWHEEPSNSTAKAASLSTAVPDSSNIPSSTQPNRITSTNAHSSKVCINGETQRGK